MTQAPPPDGPLHERFRPYIKNAQEIAPNLWLARAVRGLTGRGKKWRDILISVDDEGRYVQVSQLRPVSGAWRGKWTVDFWGWTATHVRGQLWFNNESEALAAMLAIGRELWK